MAPAMWTMVLQQAADGLYYPFSRHIQLEQRENTPANWSSENEMEPRKACLVATYTSEVKTQ